MLANIHYLLGHCGLITNVKNSFKSNEININDDATDWKHLTVELSNNNNYINNNNNNNLYSYSMYDI